MPTIFTRPPTYSPWNPGELAGPYAALTLREWEVAVATCSLKEPLTTLLREALLEPASSTCERRYRWPLPRKIALFDNRLLCLASTETLRDALLEDSAALWQILDLPMGVIPGMLRGLLLVGLGARLHQTLAALEGRGEALPPRQELEQALTTLGAQVDPAPTRPALLRQPPRRKRWCLWAA